MKLRWLALIAVILLLGSIAGDILLVHPHLASFSAGIDHSPPQYAPSPDDGLTGLLRAQEGAGVMWLPMSAAGDRGDSGIRRYFCGWHSSAYVKAATNITFFPV